MMKQASWTMAVLLCAVSGMGCSKKTNTGGAAGFAGDFGAAGFVTATGGTGAVAGMGAAGGAAGMPATTVPCGAMTCSAGGIPIPVMLCCADQATGTCGLLSGTTCTPRATPNPNCPSVTIGPANVPGCCLPDGTTCGIDGYPLMAGCASSSTLAQFGVMVAAKHCDGTPIGTAGMGGQGGAAGAAGGAAGAAGHSGAGGAAGHSGAGGGAAGHSGAGGAAGH